MTHLRDAIETKFYDPLYEVVVFTEGGVEGSGFWGSAFTKRDDLSLSVGAFLSILNTYEFSRLNFLRQAGLAWLEFPSATHTRFSHSLGCWLLSKWAASDVIVSQHMELQKGKKKILVSSLGDRLKSSGWIEEFHLALLLHDIGHFPYSHVIENNDLLLQRYALEKQTEGVLLEHGAVGRSLVTGTGSLFELFHDYIRKSFSEELDERRFLSAELRRISGVQPERIDCFMNSTAEPTNTFDAQVVKGARELISGVIDLDRLDHYHRDSHFTSVRGGEFNIRSLLRHLALADTEDDPEITVSLIGDGVQHAFQILYAKGTLTDTVFHNEHNLAYEVMLNEAINAHWDSQEPGSHFRQYLPFYDDMELFQALATSLDPRARRAIRRIRLREPLTCVGKFVLDEKVFGQMGSTTEERRARLRSEFAEALKTAAMVDGDCFLRLDGVFGKADGDSEWMNLKSIRNKNGEPLASLVDHGTFVEYILQRERVRSRSFWVFVARPEIKDKAATMVERLLEAHGVTSGPARRGRVADRH